MLIPILGVLLFVYGLVILVLYVTQARLIFNIHKDLKAPAQYGLDVEEITLKTEDGVSLTAWWRAPSSSDACIILYLHGSYSHLGHRAAKYRELCKEGFGLLALSYRGYGTSDGSPTEEGLYTDGRAAIRYLTARGVSLSRVIFYGEDLGAGIATKLATEVSPALVVLDAAYTSIAAQVKERYWFIPVDWILQYQFSPLANVPWVSAPLLVLHGESDDITPLSHAKAIYLAANEPKRLVVFTDGDHNNTNIDEIAQEIRQSLRQR